MSSSLYLPPPSPSRRKLLRRGLLGGALLAFGGLGFLVSRGTRRSKPPSKPLSVLTEDEHAVMQAIALRCVAPAPDAPPADDIAWNVDQLLALVDPAAQKEVKQLLGLFESAVAGFLLGLRVKPFTGLAPGDQDRVLREWQQSRLLLRRSGFTALKTLAMAGYYGTSATWAYLGYPGPPVDFWDPKAPEWRGGGQPRPDGPGVWKEDEAQAP